MAFIEAAAGTFGKLLTTEDGDYTTEVRDLLRDQLGVRVLNYSESKARSGGD